MKNNSEGFKGIASLINSGITENWGEESSLQYSASDGRTDGGGIMVTLNRSLEVPLRASKSGGKIDEEKTLRQI